MEEKCPKNIYDRMVVDKGDLGLSYATLPSSLREFKHGRESLDDDPHFRDYGKHVQKVHDLLLQERRIEFSLG